VNRLTEEERIAKEALMSILRNPECVNYVSVKNRESIAKFVESSLMIATEFKKQCKEQRREGE
jgi:hypothetical protein